MINRPPCGLRRGTGDLRPRIRSATCGYSDELFSQRRGFGYSVREYREQGQRLNGQLLSFYLRFKQRENRFLCIGPVTTFGHLY
jgi:hypothetical protein